MAENKETGTDARPVEPIKLNSHETVALKNLMAQRLDDCGWRQCVQNLVREKLTSDTNLTREQLSAMILPEARALVPDVVRKEMLKRVCDALVTRHSLDEAFKAESKH